MLFVLQLTASTRDAMMTTPDKDKVKAQSHGHSDIEIFQQGFTVRIVRACLERLATPVDQMYRRNVGDIGTVSAVCVRERVSCVRKRVSCACVLGVYVCTCISCVCARVCLHKSVCVCLVFVCARVACVWHVCCRPDCRLVSYIKVKMGCNVNRDRR